MPSHPLFGKRLCIGVIGVSGFCPLGYSHYGLPLVAGRLVENCWPREGQQYTSTDSREI